MPETSPVQSPVELLTHLFAAWPEVKKKQIRTWLKFKAITVNGKPVTQYNHQLKPGDVVARRSDTFAQPNEELGSGMRIVHEDAAVIVIDKPEGLLSIASEAEPYRNAYFQLTEHVREGPRAAKNRIWIVHRLDKDTSGLMVFAKTEPAKIFLQENWDKAEKKYQAVVEGMPTKEQGRLESHLNESDPLKVFSCQRNEQTRHAITLYKLLKKTPSCSLLELTLLTGRRHQIRVQLSDEGCPIVGDRKYSAQTNPAKRMGLHACFLRFPHPTTREMMAFTSPLPWVLAKLCLEK